MLTYFFIHVTYQFVFSFFRQKQVDLSYPDKLQKLQQYPADIPQINTIIQALKISDSRLDCKQEIIIGGKRLLYC